MARPPSQRTTEEVTFTPAMATDILENHAHETNRFIRQSKVNAYAADMKHGKWEMNGQTVGFDWNGNLGNGHHRMWACIEANTPFTSLVARNLDPDSFKTMDTGAPRSAADMLKIGGAAHHHRPIATACGLVMRYNSGKVIHNAPINPRDVANFFDANPDIHTWIELTHKGNLRPFAAPVAAVLYLACGRYRSRCVEFAEGLVSGADLDKGSPSLALRNRLLSGNQERLNTTERFALTIQAWNAFIEGRPLLRMQMFTGDKFPKVRGAKE